MISVLQEEGFDVQERDVNRIRQKHGWLLRMDSGRLQKKRPASHGSSPEEESADEGGEEGGEEEASATTPGYGSVIPEALADLGLTQAQAEAFHEARRQAIAADAAEKRATKKRRRWLKGRAGLPADPPGPPRFPSELSLSECKAVLSMDAASYKDVRANFRRICEEEGVVKKTVAGPQKWEAIKFQLIRGSVHLRSVFWDNLNIDQKNLALDLICCDVTKNIRQEGSRMMLHEARNVLGLNPKLARDVRFHFQKILAADHFVGKIVAGEEHWNGLVRRWLGESDILQPIAASLDAVDPNFVQKKKAIDVVARDAMKRFRDAEKRGVVADILAYDPGRQDDQQDAHGETDHEAGGHGAAMDDVSAFDDTFGVDEATQIAAQLSVEATDDSGPTPDPAMPADSQMPSDAAAPPTRKRGRPRKLPYPDPPPDQDVSGPPVKKRRGRQSRRIPQEEALAIYAHSQARFLPPPPPDAASAQGSSVSVEPEMASSLTSPGRPGIVDQHQYTPTPAPAPAPVPATVPSPPQARASTASSAATPTPARAQVQVQTQAQAAAPSPPSARRTTTTAIYFRLQPTSTVSGLPSMWIATLGSHSVEELRSKAVAKSPGAVCVVVDGIVKDGAGGEIPLPIPGDTELEAYLDHMQETHGAPTFSVELVGAP
ncbi:hypothetical protein BR93DRAFT_928425 [Coniochaeta sp. PMI_546]|nr:hypothetical protein BR93DRAFT_928425 [Coniochaeta sp. PMI_546]